MVTPMLPPSNPPPPALFAVIGPSPLSMLILGVIAILLFGERLPEVARSVGKWFVKIKREMRDFETEIRGAFDESESALEGESAPPVDREEATAPKFEPPPRQP